LTDDMLIKLWNWDKQWSCQQVFEGHTHYVMQIVINPKDNNTFASASLDRTVKVSKWLCRLSLFTVEIMKCNLNLLATNRIYSVIILLYFLYRYLYGI